MGKRAVSLGELIRAEEVARLLAVSARKVYYMVTTGELAGVKVGRSVRIFADSVEGYLAAARRRVKA